jgi:hypothetical protein
LLDAYADRGGLELRLIKLLLEDPARVHQFAGSWREAAIGLVSKANPWSYELESSARRMRRPWLITLP